ncbi:Kinesin-like protein KIN-12B [Linum perenne]
MKHFMLPRNPVLREASLNPNSDSPTPPPSSLKSKPNLSPSPSVPPRRHKFNNENAAPPSDLHSSPSPAKIRTQLPPKPPSSNPLKRKLAMDASQDPTPHDSGVQVIVRMRPSSKDDEGELTVQKLSHDSLCINGQTFRFDSVADIEATQQEIFQLIGAPLVENCLAGFNSSVFAYGQEQVKHADRQLKYQCRCSFLEIREDVKSGVYVENLTEEYVFTLKDGLSNRRTGATSVNAESSRSHSVFTCVVESRCKSMADGISSLKTSRINLVDLAGSERQKLTGAAGERLKEAGNINRSLSQLGNLINILAEVSQTGKQRHIPYRDSKLTFLLQESLGGNAKLAMVCAISPAQSCKSETFSTLRFAQRAKAIKNKAIVNEEMEDDVNHLRGVIQQLRLDEDGDEEMEIDEEAVEKFCAAASEDQAMKSSRRVTEQGAEDTDVEMEEGTPEKVEDSDIIVGGRSKSMKSVRASTDQLAASINRGLEIMDCHPRSSAFRRSAFRFSYVPAENKPSPIIEKLDVGVQTSQDDDQLNFICKMCKGKTELEELNGTDDSSNLQLVPVDDSGSAERSKVLVPKVSAFTAACFVKLYVMQFVSLTCLYNFLMFIEPRQWRRF